MPLAPYVEAKSSPFSGSFVSGSDTHEIDHLRQGVEITDSRMRLLGTLPKISAGTDNHQIPQATFGQRRDFRDDTSFTDMTTLDPSAHVGTNADAAVVSYPLTDRNPSYENLSDLDGAIEPLVIRARASLNSIEWPFDAHSVKGQVMGGNEDEVKRTDKIVDEYEFPAPNDIDPFFDAAESFGLTPSSSIQLPGINSDLERKVRPFGDRAPTLASDGTTGNIRNYLLSSSTGISGTHGQDAGYIGQDRVSATKGFEYQSARRSSRVWTDSLAFGDREDYGARGFLRIHDSLGGQYPTVMRTGDANRLGNYNVQFNDTRNIFFGTGTINVGRNLDVSSYYLGGTYLSSTYINNPVSGTTYPFLGQRTIVTPSNYAVTTQSTNVKTRPGVADVWIWSTSSDGPNFFDDSRIHISFGLSGSSSTLDEFYNTGTAVSKYPGFASSLGSKTQIKIDLTPQRDHFLYRISTPRIASLSGANTPEFSTGSSGFAYFNHTLRRWEDIGLVDPATGQPLRHDYSMTIRTAAVPLDGFAATGTNNFPCQFSMSPQTAAGGNGPTSFVASNQDAANWGYTRIGTPTNTNFAPFATIYHATQSQALRMSNYIKHPFLLEKAVLNIKVVARKIHHADTSGIRSDNDQRRDIDNYVFFMYKQARVQDPRFGKDSATDVSGSTRNLICSASFTFWNKPTVTTGYFYAGGVALPAADLAKWPLHSPAFAYDWNRAVNGTGGSHDVALDNFSEVHSASVSIPIIPAVVPLQPHGASSFPAQERSGGTDVQRVVKFQNAWVGATNQLPFMEHGTGFTGKHGLSSSINLFDPSATGYYTVKYGIYDPGLGGTGFPRTQLVDGRSFRSLGGSAPRGAQSESTFSIFTITGSAQSVHAPYVLLPTDELIFGFDAGISQFRNGASLGLTGSFLKILAKETSITLYGSLIRDGVEYHSTLNQNLTSNTVHEAIYSDDIVDQFEVEAGAVFSGSYIDSIITGTLSANGAGRGIVSSATAPVFGNRPNVTGSLFRGIASQCASERIYDTIMPDILGYLTTTNRISSVVDINGNSLVALNPTGFFVESGTYRMPYPYNNELTRRDIPAQAISLFSAAGAGTFTGVLLRRALFKVADRRRVDSAGAMSANDHAVDGAMGFRYGIFNTDPINTRVVHRYNRFGQLRDMLEQRIDTKFRVDGNPTFGIVGGALQAPVFIRFTGNNPAGTNSSNLSFEATSSLPFVDGTVRNRESPLNTGLMNSTTVEIL